MYCVPIIPTGEFFQFFFSMKKNVTQFFSWITSFSRGFTTRNFDGMFWLSSSSTRPALLVGLYMSRQRQLGYASEAGLDLGRSPQPR
jgi:hypothetical protein